MKNILLAGSSSGIGRAICENILLQGSKVIGLARDHSKFEPISAYYFPHKVDFSKMDSLEGTLKPLVQAQQKLDAIISCVGYGHFAELEQFSVRAMQEIVNVNFLSQAILVKLFLPTLKKMKSGKIILLGSECAIEGQKKGTMYCATKFALRGFAQSLRKECASSNITITLINPGAVATPFFDNLNFRPSAGSEHAIQPQQIATLVDTILNEEQNCVYEEINLQPLKKAFEKVGGSEKL